MLMGAFKEHYVNINRLFYGICENKPIITLNIQGLVQRMIVLRLYM